MQGANKHAAASCGVLTLAYSLGAKAVLPVVELGMPAAEEMPEVEVEEVVLEVTETLSNAAAPTTNSVMSKPVVRHTPMKFRRAAKKPVDCLLPSPSCTPFRTLSHGILAQKVSTRCAASPVVESSSSEMMCERPSRSATSHEVKNVDNDAPRCMTLLHDVSSTSKSVVLIMPPSHVGAHLAAA